MLYENDVKKAVVAYLKRHGYGKPMMAGLKEHGPDIVAPTPNRRKELWIEAKGETSSNPRTGRYGKPFDSGQRADHLGKAVLHCMQWMAANREVLTGIALPADGGDVELIEGIKSGLRKLNVVVFLVHQDGRVDTPLGMPREQRR